MQINVSSPYVFIILIIIFLVISVLNRVIPRLINFLIPVEQDRTVSNLIKSGWDYLFRNKIMQYLLLFIIVVILLSLTAYGIMYQIRFGRNDAAIIIGAAFFVAIIVSVVIYKIKKSSE